MDSVLSPKAFLDSSSSSSSSSPGLLYLLASFAVGYVVRYALHALLSPSTSSRKLAGRKTRSVSTQTNALEASSTDASDDSMVGMSIHRRRASSAWESKASTKEMLVYLSSKSCAGASPFLLAAGVDSLNKLGQNETLDSLEQIGVSVQDSRVIRGIFSTSSEGDGKTCETTSAKSAKVKFSRVGRLIRAAASLAISSPSSPKKSDVPQSPGGYVKRPSRGFAPIDPKMPTFAGWLEKKAESSKIVSAESLYAGHSQLEQRRHHSPFCSTYLAAINPCFSM